jgi:protein TonB
MLQTIQQFDKHLALRITPSGGNAVTITVIPRDIADTPPGSFVVIAPDTMRGDEIQEVKPVYPPLAQLAHQEGTVRLLVEIGKSGRVQDAKPVFGPPLLVPSAMEAVKQWSWNPIMLLGQAEAVVTTVDISY